MSEPSARGGDWPMKPDFQKYFIAILPSSAISDEARGRQKEFELRYDSKAAMRSPPHITLHMPFRWKQWKEDDLMSTLSEFFSTAVPFTVDVDGFGCFSPGVIFMNIIHSEGLMSHQRSLALFCRNRLGLFNTNHQDRPFHPHITLAFRDLKKHAFADAWNNYRERAYKSAFEVTSACLLKHDGRLWHPHHHFQFNTQFSSA